MANIDLSGIEMGEARRRKAEIVALKEQDDKWRASLSGEEQVIAGLALRAYEKIVRGLGMTKACYHLSFFLQEYARRNHGLRLDVVVGWINDGEWAGAASHAWLEYHGQRIDISLNKTDNPQNQPPGDLIILNRVVRKGVARYEYWVELPPSAEAVLQRMAFENPSLIRDEMELHSQMLEYASAPGGASKYLEKFPPRESSYDVLAAHMS